MRGRFATSARRVAPPMMHSFSVGSTKVLVGFLEPSLGRKQTRRTATTCTSTWRLVSIALIASETVLRRMSRFKQTEVHQERHLRARPGRGTVEGERSAFHLPVSVIQTRNVGAPFPVLMD